MSFAGQIKKARLAKGYTQQHVADLVGVTKSTYCGYETEKRQPDVAKIKALAIALEVSANYLLEVEVKDVECSAKFDQIQKKPIPENEDELNRELVKMLMQFTPAEAQRLIDFAKGVASTRKVQTSHDK